jgi:hypothetical protein
MMSLNYLLASASDADVHPPPHPQELPISGFFLADNRKSPSLEETLTTHVFEPKKLESFFHLCRRRRRRRRNLLKPG